LEIVVRAGEGDYRLIREAARRAAEIVLAILVLVVPAGVDDHHVAGPHVLARCLLQIVVGDRLPLLLWNRDHDAGAEEMRQRDLVGEGRALHHMRRRIDGDTQPEFPIFEDLKKEGITDYLAFVSGFDEEWTQGILGSWSTDRPGGFNESDIAALLKIQGRLAVAGSSFRVESARAEAKPPRLEYSLVEAPAKGREQGFGQE
jgi:hypothetical protein